MDSKYLEEVEMVKEIGLSTSCSARRKHRMQSVCRRFGVVVGAVALSTAALAPLPAGAQVQAGGWISTWTASQQPPRGVMPASFSNQTVRQVVRVSVGGSKVRVRLSNEFGTKPVLIDWIRTSGAFDGIIDFEPVLADPGRPASMLGAYDSGDRLHPNDAGYKAMGESIDLKIFQ